MLAPKFLIDKFSEGKRASVSFRSGAGGSGLPGVVVGWEEHHEELASYVLFKTLDDSVLHVPFADIYLSELSDENYEEAADMFALSKRLKVVKQENLVKQVEAAEKGESSLAQPGPGFLPGMPGFGGGGPMM